MHKLVQESCCKITLWSVIMSTNGGRQILRDVKFARCNYVLPTKERPHVGFDVDPVGVGIGVTFSCVQDIP